MPEKDQIFIFNSAELSLIKNTFADSDTLLYTIRKVLLQFPLTETEKGLIRTAVTPEVVAVLRKRMLPDLEPDLPLGQLSSLLSPLGRDLQSKNIEDMAPLFEAKRIEATYLDQRLRQLANIDAAIDDEISLTDLGRLEGKEPAFRYIDVTAYLYLLGYIDPGLSMIKAIAGAKDETPEQQKKRLQRDSTK